MPELEAITIKGFKSITAVENLKLKTINVVIGPNGSGKSNFIGVFSFLNAIREGRLQDYVGKAGGADRVLHFGSKTTSTMHLSIAFEGRVNGYEIDLQATGSDELIPTHEIVSYWDQSGCTSPMRRSLSRSGKEAGISGSGLTGIPGYVKKHLDTWRVYHFHDTSSTSPMKKVADLNDNRFLRQDGSNLAPFLYYLLQKEQASYQLIRMAVQRVAPFFEDFQLEPARLNEDKIRLEWKHKGTSDYFDSSSLSDGSLRFIALATLFLQPEKFRPSVILVDEPELGLHPYAITLLSSLIKQTAGKTQVIISTQSSQLLDQFDPEDVLVAERVEGGTRFTRLDSERLGTWLEDYSLGQLWEKNELGGRPSGE